MKHPSNEDWMEVLYGEASPEKRQACEQHRKQCSECRTQLKQWREAQDGLNHWANKSFYLSEHTRLRSSLWSGVFWKAAAVLLIGLSFFVGHRSGSQSIDKAALLAELSNQIRSEIQSTLETHPSLAGIDSSQAHQDWDEIRQELQEMIRKETSQSAAAIAQLRQETSAVMDRFHTQLETVALVAEDRYQRSQDQLSSLGALAQYSAHPIGIQHNLNR